MAITQADIDSLESRMITDAESNVSGTRQGDTFVQRFSPESQMDVLTYMRRQLEAKAGAGNKNIKTRPGMSLARFD